MCYVPHDNNIIEHLFYRVKSESKIVPVDSRTLIPLRYPHAQEMPDQSLPEPTGRRPGAQRVLLPSVP